MSVLIISEKNKAAQAIAQSLGKTKKIRHSKSVSVYNVTAKNIYVVPLRGHIKQYKNTKPYQKWTSKDPKKIITDPKAIYKMNSRYAGSYISALKKYGKRANLCVIG